ncbi:MAG: FAD-dependent oxidoreductase [Bacteroidetes bacterium]|nr:FAD-dependent oxidoreductase [Bacteroidota bacterium]MBS1930766.1 FAD-dependent oxidoreductase [Bacteroidota bacterium]
MALLPWQTGKVIRIEDHTHNTRRFWIEVPGLTSFNFIPGQFVTLDLPIHEKPNKRWRSYSIASWPDGTNVFELVIVLTPGGAGTNYLFNNVTMGSELSFRGAQGVFTLHNDLDKEIFMICTGTGIAPFRSMMNYLRIHKTPFKKINLIFGCRYQKDILYFEEMKNLQNELPGFQYIPTLSREEWEGEKGYVHPVYEELVADRQPAHFYLCGWKNMIDEAKKRILDLGYDRKSIHQELYG